jgi:hypothetical protein
VIYLIEFGSVSFYRNIDDVDKTMDEINEQTENMKQIQEALSAPIGAAAYFDEVILSNVHLFVMSVENRIFDYVDLLILSRLNSKQK